jgi:hypothetical protein
MFLKGKEAKSTTAGSNRTTKTIIFSHEAQSLHKLVSTIAVYGMEGKEDDDDDDEEEMKLGMIFFPVFIYIILHPHYLLLLHQSYH